MVNYLIEKGFDNNNYADELLLVKKDAIVVALFMKYVNPFDATFKSVRYSLIVDRLLKRKEYKKKIIKFFVFQNPNILTK